MNTFVKQWFFYKLLIYFQIVWTFSKLCEHFFNLRTFFQICYLKKKLWSFFQITSTFFKFHEHFMISPFLNFSKCTIFLICIKPKINFLICIKLFLNVLTPRIIQQNAQHTLPPCWFAKFGTVFLRRFWCWFLPSMFWRADRSIQQLFSKNSEHQRCCAASKVNTIHTM